MFIPAKYLTPGQQWGKLFSQYEEGAEQSGSTVFSMPISFQNKMSKYRKEYRITDYASTEVLLLRFQTLKVDFMIHGCVMQMLSIGCNGTERLKEVIGIQEVLETVLGANGRPVRMGAGVQEQLEDSHMFTDILT